MGDQPASRTSGAAGAAAAVVGACAAVAGVVPGCASGPVLRDVPADGFVLRSRLERPHAEQWMARIAAEIGRVDALLGPRGGAEPLTVHLHEAPVEEGAALLEVLAPRFDGVRGWSVGGTEIHLVIGGDGGRFSIRADEVLRHELAHVWLAAKGIPADPWFDEGLAHEVEDAVAAGPGLVLHPAPLQIALARATTTDAAAAETWEWDGGRTPDPEREAVLRAVSRSFVRFLVERTDDPGWPTRLGEVAASDPAGDAGLVREWRAWLDGFDLVARIERGLRDPDREVRTAAARTLPAAEECVRRLAPILPGMPGAFDRGRADLAAIEALDDPDCAAAAGRYLVYFRAPELAGAAMERLRSTNSTQGRLVALAVRARRGESADLGDARDLWAKLDEPTRRRLSWLRIALALGP